MRESVNHGRRHLVIGEETAPLRELEVRGQDEAAGLVAVGDDAEQSRRAVPVHRDIPPLVQHQQVSALEVLLEPLQGACAAGFAEAEHEIGDREEADRVPLLTGVDAQGRCKMRHHGNRQRAMQRWTSENTRSLTQGSWVRPIA